VYCLDHSCSWHSFNMANPSQSLCSGEVYYVVVLLFHLIHWLVFIGQKPFSWVGPNIFLKIFLSKTISLWVIVSFSVHVSHAYVTIGLMDAYYVWNKRAISILLPNVWCP
jgi:hypothetical protein